MIKKLKSVALATGLAAVGVLGGAGIANAEATQPSNGDELRVVTNVADANTNRVWDFCGEYKGRGIGCFANAGDHVLARDTYADGLWVRVDWLTDYDRDGACTDKSSAGDGNDCNYNMKENQKMKFQVELWDGKTRVDESEWTKWLTI